MSDVFRRCSCRDEAGRQLGARCPKLETDRKHGTWAYRLSAGTDPRTGKRVQTYKGGFTTKRDAQTARNAVADQISSGAYRYDGRQTTGEFLTGWIEAKVADGLRPSSALMYRRYVEMDLIPALGRIRLADLTEVHVEDMIRDLRAAGRGATTVRRIHAVLRSALSSAKAKRLVRTNVASDVAGPSVQKSKVRPWEPEEVGTFLDAAAAHRLGALFELAVFSGLRRGELIGLRWEDVDLTRGLLRVRTQRVQVGGQVVEGKPKTKAGEDRRVDLGDRAIGALIGHRLQQDQERNDWGAGYQDHGLVFAKEDGTALLPQYVTRLFDTLTERASLRRVRFHDLRHAAASLMLSAGVDIAVVSKRLGHSSIAITSDVYGHLVGGAGRSAAQAAESLVPTTTVHTLHTHLAERRLSGSA
jgi:integrase